MTCEVCCDTFNLTTRKKTTCPYCPYQACAGCAKRYLCETPDDAHCMACRKGWSMEIMVQNFTQQFVTKTYKKRREDLLLEREKSLMPATQPYVEAESAVRKLNTQIAVISHDHHKSMNRWHVLRNRQEERCDFDESVLRNWQSEEERKVFTSLAIDIKHLGWHRDRILSRVYSGHIDQEKRAFVRACPYGDCRGFLSSAWKCGLCEMWACHECHEVKGPHKDDPHTCNPDSVATAQLLARDSRHCPKCAAMIFKINGCDQMFCTQCHTAFSWRTGRVETGLVHNPHYYEYMRSQGNLPRNQNDVPCGGLPNWSVVYHHTGNSPFRKEIDNAFRSYPHIQYVMLPRYTNDMNNRDLRIKLMIGDMTEDVFKRRIQQRDKARQRKTDIRQVLEMYMAVLVDLFQALVQTGKVDEIVISLQELRLHTNSTLETVSKRFSNCAVPVILDSFSVV